jgi:hypothetical protein
MKRIGEVIASATTHFMAQALRDPDRGLSMPKAPAFGSWVRAHLEEDGLDVYGVVYHAETTSIDATHKPFALNLSRQELREQQPQIFELLRTDFSLVITGYRQDGRIRVGLPPTPPLVHDFVYACEAEEVVALTERLDFLRTLLTFAQAPSDELVAATLRHAYAKRGDDRSFLLGAGRTLSNLLKSDYDRLNAIVQRLAP